MQEAAEGNTSLELCSDVLSDKLCVEVGAADLDDVQSDALAELLLQLQLVCVGRQLFESLALLLDGLLRGLHVEVGRVAKLLVEEQLFERRLCGLTHAAKPDIIRYHQQPAGV